MRMMRAWNKTFKDIARRLDLSVKTVDMHRTMLMKELDIHDIAGLVRYAIRGVEMVMEIHTLCRKSVLRFGFQIAQQGTVALRLT
jgi:regulatory LuxR family protein